MGQRRTGRCVDPRLALRNLSLLKNDFMYYDPMEDGDEMPDDLADDLADDLDEEEEDDESDDEDTDE